MFLGCTGLTLLCQTRLRRHLFSTWPSWWWCASVRGRLVARWGHECESSLPQSSERRGARPLNSPLPHNGHGNAILPWRAHGVGRCARAQPHFCVWVPCLLCVGGCGRAGRAVRVATDGPGALATRAQSACGSLPWPASAWPPASEVCPLRHAPPCSSLPCTRPNRWLLHVCAHDAVGVACPLPCLVSACIMASAWFP